MSFVNENDNDANLKRLGGEQISDQILFENFSFEI